MGRNKILSFWKRSSDRSSLLHSLARGTQFIVGLAFAVIGLAFQALLTTTSHASFATQFDCSWPSGAKTSAKGCFSGVFTQEQSVQSLGLLPSEGPSQEATELTVKPIRLQLLIVFTFDGPVHKNIESIWTRVSKRGATLLWNAIDQQLGHTSLASPETSLMLWTTGSANLGLDLDELVFIINRAGELAKADQVEVSFLTISGGYDGFRTTLNNISNIGDAAQLVAPQLTFGNLLFFDSFFDSRKYLENIWLFQNREGLGCFGYYSKKFARVISNAKKFERILLACKFEQRQNHIDFSKLLNWWTASDAVGLPLK